MEEEKKKKKEYEIRRRRSKRMGLDGIKWEGVSKWKWCCIKNEKKAREQGSGGKLNQATLNCVRVCVQKFQGSYLRKKQNQQRRLYLLLLHFVLLLLLSILSSPLFFFFSPTTFSL